MNKQWFKGKAIIVLMAVLVGNCISPLARANEKTNILFIFADDWGWGDLSCHGHPYVKTPNIDRLAQEGMDFHHFVVASGVCSPSRTAVMTGHFPARYNIDGHFAWAAQNAKRNMPDWLDPEVTMLPRILRGVGYATGHFGKWHLTSAGVSDAPLPPEYGYDEYGVFNAPGDQIEKSASAACPLAVDFIKRHKDEPLFINLWLHETHLPHLPLEQYLKRFRDLDEQKRVYAAVVAEADACVGQVMDTLRELGLDDNTLVLFSSDNGPEWTGNKKKKEGLGSYLLGWRDRGAERTKTLALCRRRPRPVSCTVARRGSSGQGESAVSCDGGGPPSHICGTRRG